MNYNQAFRAERNGNCGPMGRGRFGGFRGRHAGGFAQPPVNIEETDAQYLISLFAAGLVKDNVELSVKDDILTIAYRGADQPTGPESTAQGNYTYQEYKLRSFERAFRLNDKVLVEGISASYADGVLRVTLPKNPATNKPAQVIPLA